jgi:glucose-6-phosphate-specific signal transduction histidine kinase
MIAKQLAVRQFGPWFQRRPRSAVAVASMLALAVWGLGLALPGDRAALAVLFALPIALLAVAFGCTGGAIAGVGAMALIVAWGVPVGTGGIGVSGWASAAAMLMLGALLGAAVDGLAASEQRARQADDFRHRLEETAQRHLEAVEINDTLVQSAAVAKWALETGDVERALEVLEETVDAGQRLVTALIKGDPFGNQAAGGHRQLEGYV